MPNYTTEDLIQYLYHETSERETKAIANAIQSDWTLQKKFEALKDTVRGLDNIVESPRHQSVMAILNYAKSSSEVEQS